MVFQESKVSKNFHESSLLHILFNLQHSIPRLRGTTREARIPQDPQEGTTMLPALNIFYKKFRRENGRGPKI